MSSSTQTAARAGRPLRLLRERMALLIFAASTLSYVTFMLYAEHVDREFASGRIEGVYAAGLFAPILLLAVALVLVVLSEAWTVREKLVAASLSLSWIACLVVGSTDLGCDDIGGGGSRCAIGETSTSAEVIVLAIAVVTLIACAWLHDRADTRTT